MDRRLSEQAFHDRQARQRAVFFARHPALLPLDREAYLDHETWIRPAIARLELAPGMKVLDLGCGHGMASVLLQQTGGQVTALDLSAGYLAEAAQRARASHAAVAFVQASGEQLPFADACFDRIWGNAILHHLDMARAARELHRVLRPGGRCVFCEPWGENPLLTWARARLGNGHTPHERPLRWRDIQTLRTVFPRVEVQGYQLLAAASRLPGLRAGLAWCDRKLLRTLPVLQRLCRYAVLEMGGAGTQHRPCAGLDAVGCNQT